MDYGGGMWADRHKPAALQAKGIQKKKPGQALLRANNLAPPPQLDVVAARIGRQPVTGKKSQALPLHMRGRERERSLEARHHRSISPSGRENDERSQGVGSVDDDFVFARLKGKGLQERRMDERRGYDKVAQDYNAVLRNHREKRSPKQQFPAPATSRNNSLQPQHASGNASSDGESHNTKPLQRTGSSSNMKLPPLAAQKQENGKNEKSGLVVTTSFTPPPKSLTPTPTPTFLTGDALESSRGRDTKAVPRTNAAQPRAGAGGAGGGRQSSAEEYDSEYNTAPDAGAMPKRRKTGRISVVVRKRPLGEFELGEDCVVVNSPTIQVGAIKQRVDLSEYTESHEYAFDSAFGAVDNNERVYSQVGTSLLNVVFEGGSASCFAYGQTGSGKTHTMIGTDTEPGFYVLAAKDIFQRVLPSHRVFVSLYEIYCNSLFDLLNQRAVVVTREDANKRINVCGLSWHEIAHVKDLIRVIERGAIQRRTGSTSANEYSSRSHAIMTITLRDENQPKFLGSLNIVDLAGSERAADTAANDKVTRQEGGEINKSLLALKECIRGLDERKKHIPFRGSKLTEVLRDSFVGNSRTVMIATISPSSENAEHTLNTLRYAFRVKGLSIENKNPSKERNAPRIRSKSIDVNPELEERKRRRKARELRREQQRARGLAGAGKNPFAVEMEELLGQMEFYKQVKANDELKIKKLEDDNVKMQRRMEELQRMVAESHKSTESSPSHHSASPTSTL